VRDLKYRELVIDQSYVEVDQEIKTQELVPAAKAFIRNMDRLTELVNAPHFLVQVATNLEYHTSSMLESKLSVDERRGLYGLSGRKPSEHALSIREEVRAQWIALYKKDETDFYHKPKKPGTLVQSLLDNWPEATERPLDAIMSTIIVGTWTAFETLAGDLWVRAVNRFPRLLSRLNGRPVRIDELARRKTSTGATGYMKRMNLRDDGGEADYFDVDDSSSKGITLGEIHKITRGSCDLSQSMGDLLVSTKKVKFTSLADIREAYSLAFSEKCKKARPDKIDEALADNRLKATSLVRNLLVHKGGVADSVYVDESKSAPTAPRLEAGTALALDGELSNSLVGPAILSGVNLIKSVDAFIYSAAGEMAPNG
jgi:hypothetical protein